MEELKSEIEKLKTLNAMLDKENEEYSGVWVPACVLTAHVVPVSGAVSGLLPSEEVADMKRKMKAMETELERRHSVIMTLHGMHMCVYVCVCMYMRVCVCIYTCLCMYSTLLFVTKARDEQRTLFRAPGSKLTIITSTTIQLVSVVV